MKNWSRERWRRLYLREAAQQRALWPLMQRGTRDYCIKIAEDDGTLTTLEPGADPVQVLARVLGAHQEELALVELAIRGLLDDGFLEADEHRVFVPNLPIAQGDDDLDYEAAGVQSEPVQVGKSAAERARDYRARQRQKRHAARDGASQNTVTDRHEPSRDAPSHRHVTVSRGDSQKDTPNHLLARQTSQKNQPDPNTQARDGARDASRDGASSESVTGSRDVTRDVTGRDTKAMAEHWLKSAQDAVLTYGPFETWPEVKLISSAFEETWGRSDEPRHAGDPRGKLMLARFAEGYTVEKMVLAVRRSKFADYMVEKQSNQSLMTILRDAGQVDKFAALTAPKPGPARGRAAPPQGDHGKTGWEVTQR